MKAKRLCDTRKLTREQWLGYRRKGIGGSDSPVLFLGKDYPFDVTPLSIYKDKLGLAPDREPTAAMRRGTALEPLAAEMFAALYPTMTVERCHAILQHPKHKWMLADVDRIVKGHGQMGVGILEIKCPGPQTIRKIKNEGIPDYYQIQLQHYLAVTGYKWGSLAILDIMNWELLKPFMIERDDELIDQIIDVDAKFWDCVKRKEPPEEMTEKEADLAPLKTDKSAVNMDNDKPFIQALTDWAEARDCVAQAQEYELESKTRVRNLMSLKNALVATCHLGSVRIKTSARKTFDASSFTRDHPELSETLEKYYKTGKFIESITPYLRREGDQQ